jgi:hypothetical protein
MEPAAQLVHPVFVVPVLYVPARHNVQLDAPVPAKPVEEPAPQLVQPVFVAPVLYVPAVHNVQLVAPVSTTPVEEPAPQFVQDDAPAAEYVPAGQAPQSVVVTTIPLGAR